MKEKIPFPEASGDHRLQPTEKIQLCISHFRENVRYFRRVRKKIYAKMNFFSRVNTKMKIFASTLPYLGLG
jgi:hypothetical protein